MGAGTGPLSSNTEWFQVTVDFVPGFRKPAAYPPDSNHAFNCYLHFKDAVLLLLDALWEANGRPSNRPQIVEWDATDHWILEPALPSAAVQAKQAVADSVHYPGAPSVAWANVTTVTHMTMRVYGPLRNGNERRFNLALNRLLWGGRTRRPGIPSHVTFSVQRTAGTAVGPQWQDENT